MHSACAPCDCFSAFIRIPKGLTMTSHRFLCTHSLCKEMKACEYTGVLMDSQWITWRLLCRYSLYKEMKTCEYTHTYIIYTHIYTHIHIYIYIYIYTYTYIYVSLSLSIYIYIYLNTAIEDHLARLVQHVFKQCTPTSTKWILVSSSELQWVLVSSDEF